MFQVSRSLKKAILLIALVIASLAVFAPRTGLMQSERAQDPVQKYADLGKVPMEKRRSAFNDGSPRDRSDIVRVQLALYLARHSELNDAQKKLILESMSLTTPELYGAPRSPDEKVRGDELMRQLQIRMLAVFSREELGRLFGPPGPPGTQDDLLQKYRDLSTLPMTTRRTAFREASANDKSDLWRTHLALYLARHPELNEDQKQVILEGMSLAAPDAFAVGSDTPDWKTKVQDPTKQFEGRILASFSKEEAARVFGTLGDPQH